MKLLTHIVKEVVSFLFTLLVMFAVIKLVFAFVIEPFSVDGASMEYTLHHGERMFMFKTTDIERFDIIIFPSPYNREELYVKRVIGVPGDSIAYEDGHLILNGEPLKEPYLAEMEQELGDDAFTYPFELVEITGETIVPEGKFFVLGDNRRNSTDGRRFGFINQDDVVGEANAVYWPLNQIRMIDQYELNADGTQIVQE